MDDNMKIKFTKIDVNSYKGFIKGELVVAEQGNELNTALVLYGWDEVGLYNHEFINPVYGFIEGVSRMILIRESQADSLFKHILSVNYTSSWEIVDANKPEDINVINPRVYFKTKAWNKLLKLLDTFISKNRPSEFTDFTSDMDLMVGEFISIKYSIETF